MDIQTKQPTIKGAEELFSGDHVTDEEYRATPVRRADRHAA